ARATQRRDRPHARALAAEDRSRRPALLPVAPLGAVVDRRARVPRPLDRLLLPRGQSAVAGVERIHVDDHEAALSSSSSALTLRRTRAGFPTTSIRGSTSFVTTAPAPTNASSPTTTPGHRIAPPPTRAPRRTVGPLISS